VDVNYKSSIKCSICSFIGDFTLLHAMHNVYSDSCYVHMHLRRSMQDASNEYEIDCYQDDWLDDKVRATALQSDNVCENITSLSYDLLSNPISISLAEKVFVTLQARGQNIFV